MACGWSAQRNQPGPILLCDLARDRSKQVAAMERAGKTLRPPSNLKPFGVFQRSSCWNQQAVVRAYQPPAASMNREGPAVTANTRIDHGDDDSTDWPVVSHCRQQVRRRFGIKRWCVMHQFDNRHLRQS